MLGGLRGRVKQTKSSLLRQFWICPLSMIHLGGKVIELSILAEYSLKIKKKKSQENKVVQMAENMKMHNPIKKFVPSTWDPTILPPTPLLTPTQWILDGKKNGSLSRYQVKAENNIKWYNFQSIEKNLEKIKETNYIFSMKELGGGTQTW